jgi:hypothetical protein
MTICSSSNPVYRPSGPLGLNYELGNRGLRPRQRLYQPSGLRPARRRSPAEIRPGSGSPAEIRLFGFSPEGDTSLPVCVSHRNWENTPNLPSPEGVELKAERRKPSGEKHCEIEDNPSLTGVLAHFRFQHHCPQARRAGTSSAGGDNHRSGHPPSAKPGGLAHQSGGMAVCSSSNPVYRPSGPLGL